jgi:hypothetical protein
MGPDRWRAYLQNRYVQFALVLLALFVLTPDKFTGEFDSYPWWIWLGLFAAVAGLLAAGIRRVHRG